MLYACPRPAPTFLCPLIRRPNPVSKMISPCRLCNPNGSLPPLSRCVLLQKAKAGGTPKGRPKARAGSGGGGAAKKGAKGKNGAAAGGKGVGEAPAKKTRKPSTVMWRVSDELAAVVGSNEGTVDTIRSGVYGYIKEHNLQVCTYETFTSPWALTRSHHVLGMCWEVGSGWCSWALLLGFLVSQSTASLLQLLSQVARACQHQPPLAFVVFFGRVVKALQWRVLWSVSRMRHA